jgi:hypothetical protein
MVSQIAHDHVIVLGFIGFETHLLLTIPSNFKDHPWRNSNVCCTFLGVALPKQAYTSECSSPAAGFVGKS